MQHGIVGLGVEHENFIDIDDADLKRKVLAPSGRAKFLEGSVKGDGFDASSHQLGGGPGFGVRADGL